MTARDGGSGNMGPRVRCTACSGVGWVHAAPEPDDVLEDVQEAVEQHLKGSQQHTHTTADGFFMADEAHEGASAGIFLMQDANTSQNFTPVAERFTSGGIKSGRYASAHSNAPLSRGSLPPGVIGAVYTAPSAPRRRSLGRASMRGVEQGMDSASMQSLASHVMSIDEMLRNNARVSYKGVPSFQTA